MLPLGCCTLKRPKIEATLTTVTGYCSGDFRDITSMPLSTPMRLMSRHNRQPSFSPKDGQIEKVDIYQLHIKHIWIKASAESN